MNFEKQAKNKPDIFCPKSNFTFNELAELHLNILYAEVTQTYFFVPKIITAKAEIFYDLTYGTQ